MRRNIRVILLTIIPTISLVGVRGQADTTKTVPDSTTKSTDASKSNSDSNNLPSSHIQKTAPSGSNPPSPPPSQPNPIQNPNIPAAMKKNTDTNGLPPEAIVKPNPAYVKNPLANVPPNMPPPPPNMPPLQQANNAKKAEIQQIQNTISGVNTNSGGGNPNAPYNPNTAGGDPNAPENQRGRSSDSSSSSSSSSSGSGSSDSSSKNSNIDSSKSNQGTIGGWRDQLEHTRHDFEETIHDPAKMQTLTRMFLERLGLVLNIALFVSPIGSMQKMQKDVSVGNINPFMFTSMLACTGMWLMYSICIKEHVLVVSNTVGASLSAYYVWTFSIYVKKDRSKNEMFIQQVQIVVLLFIIGIVCLLFFSLDHLGSICSAMSIVLVGGPILEFYNVIKTKNTEPLGAPEMAVASNLGCIVWFTLGAFYMHKLQVWLPNAFGFFVSATSLFLFATVGRQKVKKRWSVMKRHTVMGAKQVVKEGRLPSANEFLDALRSDLQHELGEGVTGGWDYDTIQEDQDMMDDDDIDYDVNSNGTSNTNTNRNPNNYGARQKLYTPGIGGRYDQITNFDDDDEDDIITSHGQQQSARGNGVTAGLNYGTVNTNSNTGPGPGTFHGNSNINFNQNQMHNVGTPGTLGGNSNGSNNNKVGFADDDDIDFISGGGTTRARQDSSLSNVSLKDYA